MAKRLPTTEVRNLISRAEMFDAVLVADPSFTPIWEEFLGEWRGHRGGLPQYLALSELARHLIGSLEVGDTARFDAIFNVVEQWHRTGGEYVREAATIGLLEDLQNTGLHRSTTPDEFLRWLRPTSKRFWYKVEAFWRDGTPIMPD